MTNYFKKQLGGYLFCFLVSVAVLAEDRRIIYATQCQHQKTISHRIFLRAVR